MRLVLRYLILSGIAFTCFLSAAAQDRCGTVPYSKALNGDYQLRKTRFEEWIDVKRQLRRNSSEARQRASPYRIPVVVHIIHNGEPIGSGANIPEAQVLSQLRVLNEDFNRQNADRVNTPAVFESVAGSLDVEFVLAKRDPDGIATNGIVRVNGNRSSWTMNDNYSLKSLSYWPAEEYMNIWVCNLTDGHAGYAQFPESNLPGMENSSTNRLTDGVVIWHRAFGSEDDGPFSLDRIFNKGRTATHEIGHFLGLNHIWADENGCSGTDYVSDTPNQGPASNGCPTHPKMDNCSSMLMFQNFLDYTNDACMNLFTQGQVERMIVVLENSPRRNSLLSSPGLQEPDPLPNDLGIRAVVSPNASVCSNSLTPVLEVRNYGSNAVTTASIRFVMDGTIVEVKDFTLSLNPQEAIEVAFSTVAIPSGSHDLAFQILSTNGGTDSGSYNDLKTATIVVPFFAATPLTENFSQAPEGWITRNPDGQITWQIVTAPSEVSTNKALKMDFFNYEDKVGEIDVFLSPVVDLSSVPAATLTFDVAYAQYQSSNERLQVVVLTDCAPRTEGTIIYDKAGDALQTAPSTTSPFTPSDAGQWRKELLDINAFVGMQRVQFAFVGINDWGNNLYLDNISLFTEERSDVALLQLDTPSMVTCVESIAPDIRIQNTGSVVIQSVVVDYQVNDAPVQTLAVSDLNLAFGGEHLLSLPQITLNEGNNTLMVNVRDPNGQPDNNNANNSDTFVIVVNNERDRIPLRQNFEQDFAPGWTVVSANGDTQWEITDTNFGRSLYINSIAHGNPGEEAWLVSPVLDFSGTNDASMLFDISAGIRGSSVDLLRILASTDCGVSYEALSYPAQSGFASDDGWIPQSEDDWKRNVAVNLNALAGQEDVRIAFVVRNQQGNNLYLDNIEFFVSADPGSIEIAELYSVYGYDRDNPELTELKITFNLPQRQDVRYNVIDVTGKLETDGVLTDV
ncbi:MAG TPA: choice-of-anchor J domain-containing protein, partial [Chryseosolibacter sp.]|nr:choice-of-anchor J domain-containing protein [Chryseosolibacter sp.]